MYLCLNIFKQMYDHILKFPGTGKTISLLCSTLAWIENQKANLPIESDFEIPKVIYATRTHQQIKQGNLQRSSI